MTLSEAQIVLSIIHPVFFPPCSEASMSYTNEPITVAEISREKGLDALTHELHRAYVETFTS